MEILRGKLSQAWNSLRRNKHIVHDDHSLAAVGMTTFVGRDNPWEPEPENDWYPDETWLDSPDAHLESQYDSRFESDLD